jgi:hypothetical protein
MEHNTQADILSKPRCPGCGRALIYEVKMDWFYQVVKKFYRVRKFFCVNCMSGKYVFDKSNKR